MLYHLAILGKSAAPKVYSRQTGESAFRKAKVRVDRHLAELIPWEFGRYAQEAETFGKEMAERRLTRSALWRAIVSSIRKHRASVCVPLETHIANCEPVSRRPCTTKVQLIKV